MKLLLQIIGLYVPGTTSLQVTATIGSATILLNKLSSVKQKWKRRKKDKVIINDFWAIE